ncbi:MAG: dinitrogenase iron-molybdenum cofactor [Clostridiales bacterium GWF2_38_85]|nr:MAG: dinitrogenase iron-molybdenum cofactor [Clostridiales bacterium GWF2_38_85]HBL84521.1 dinitrogenase iron-molybdenum cofactor [Clostridiales bacterium]
MKIAISTDGVFVSEHFGRCPVYTIAEIIDGKVANIEKVPNPGHSPGAIPEFLNKRGIKAIICGGIGARAIGFFSEYGIEVIAGITGKIDNVLAEYAEGTLVGGVSPCTPGGGRGYGFDKDVCDHAHDHDHHN